MRGKSTADEFSGFVWNRFLSLRDFAATCEDIHKMFSPLMLATTACLPCCIMPASGGGGSIPGVLAAHSPCTYWPWAFLVRT